MRERGLDADIKAAEEVVRRHSDHIVESQRPPVDTRPCGMPPWSGRRRAARQRQCHVVSVTVCRPDNVASLAISVVACSPSPQKPLRLGIADLVSNPSENLAPSQPSS